MARIKTYDPDLVITGKEKVIGSDVDGKTLNYEIDAIRDYVRGTSDGFEQDNLRIIITTEPGEANEYDISEMINNDQFLWEEGAGVGEPKLTVLDRWLMIFRVPVTGTTSNSTAFSYDYYLLLNKGKGTYGLNGEISTSPNDFLKINEVELESISSELQMPPKVFNVPFFEGTTSPNITVNNSTSSYVLNENRDYYFRVFSRVGVTQNQRSDYSLYRFLGSNGVYGQGGTATSNSDFLLIERPPVNSPTTGLRVVRMQLGTTIDPANISGDNILKAIQRSFRGTINISTDDLYIFEVRRRQGNSLYNEKYYWCAGRMQDIANNATINDFYLDFKDIILSAEVPTLSTIVDIPHEDVNEPAAALNNSTTQVVVGTNKPYIAVNDIDSTKLGYKLYSFVGDEGTYGVGGDSTAVSGDFEEVVINENVDKYATLEDVEDLKQEILTEDNTFQGKITLEDLLVLTPINKPAGQEGMIFRDAADPNKIKVYLNGQFQILDMSPEAM